MPLAAFRDQWHVPPEFRVALFSPKNWEGLGSIDRAGPALTQMKQNLLQAVPSQINVRFLREHAVALGGLFRNELQLANVQIGLREVEVDFAAAGFQDVMDAVALRLMRLGLSRPTAMDETFDFEAIYQHWLDDSARVFEQEFEYPHLGEVWQVQVVHYAYGRVGLQVTMPAQRVYVLDAGLACPAAGYMHELCAEVAARLCQATVTN
jgi:hypothetical protein